MEVTVPYPSLFNALSYPFVAILAVLHWKRLLYVTTRDIPLLILLGTALASVIWSADLSMTMAGNRGLVRTFVFGIYFASRYTLKDQMKIIGWVCAIAAVLSLAVGVVLPNYGIGEDGWLGIFPYKNYLARSMALGGILFLVLALNYRKQRWLGWIGLALTVTLILLSRSASILIILFFFVSLMPLYQLIKQPYRIKVILLSLTTVLTSGAALLVANSLEFILVDLLDKDLLFNGRIPVWHLVIEKSLDKLWLGYGYNAFWSSDAGVDVIVNSWASDRGIIPESFNAHNGYLEVLSQLGLWGILIYVIVICTVFFKTFILLAGTKQVKYFWVFQCLVFLFLTSVADVGSNLLSTNFYGTFGIGLCLSIALEYQRATRKKIISR
ncbi:MAG: O-antigen ligase family protein [Pleurocapsa sp.]